MVVALEVVRVAVRQKSEYDTDIVNVYHYEYQGTPPETDADVLADFATGMNLIYFPLNGVIPAAQIPVDLKIDVVELIGGVLSIVRNVGTIAWGTTYNPTATGDAYALGVAIGIILRTLVGKVFGRKFIGALTETVLSGQQVATGSPTTCVNNFLAVVDQPVTGVNGNFSPGILSTRTAQFEHFVGADCATEIYYQRRRALRMGS